MTQARYSAKYADSWAIVVGINDYKHVSPLKSATNDAKAFAAQLTSRFAFPRERVTLLLDKEATLQRIQSSIHGLIRATGPDDRVIVFYAGHGHTVPSYGRESGFLVPIDGKADDTSTLLPWDDLASTARIIPAKHMLFIMDACYGGLFGARSLAPGAARFARDMLNRYSRQFLAAGKANEPVADSGGPRSGHSVFTGHLLDALDGQLPMPEGLLSANAVMAYVYDRVSKDPYSRQSPHYGFLHGDGDLFFLPPAFKSDPDAQEPASDVLVEVPPELAEQESNEGESALAHSPLELVKEYLSDHRYRIKLNDLVLRELRAAQQRLGEEHFSVQGGGVTKEGFAERLLKYEAAIGDLMRISVLLGRWAEPEQQFVIRQLVNVLAGQIESKGGTVIWLALRSYPMLLTMFAGGIAALEGENYASLKTLLSTPVPDTRRGGEKAVVQATSDAMLDVERTDAFKLLPEHERHYTPRSEYLFKRMQPVVEDVLFLGNRYEGLFDRFEIFYALTNADFSDRDWGHVGRFGWKFCRDRGENDPFSTLVEEAKRAGDNWPPVRAGLFRGSHAHFATVAERFRKGLLERLSWH